MIETERFIDQVTVSPDEVDRLHVKQERICHRRISCGDYVLLSAGDFQDQVLITNEDVRAAYDSEVVTAANETERRSHILISSSIRRWQRQLI